MKSTIISLITLGLLLTGCQSNETPTPPNMGNNYTENDAERTVTLRVKDAISNDIFLSTQAKNVKVTTQQGTVTLNGYVDSEKEKEQLIKKISRIEGVKKVIDKLSVKADGSVADAIESTASKASSTIASSAENLVENENERAISRKVRQAIEEDSSLSSNARNIKVSTSEGVVTLRGYVSSEKERDGILRRVNQISGVKNVDDRLQVGSTSEGPSVKEKIKSSMSSAGEAAKSAGESVKAQASSAASSAASALENITENDAEKAISQRVRDAINNDSAFSPSARQVKVSTSKGVVTLRGAVANPGEKTALVRKVRQTSGVQEVDDKTVVNK